MESSYMYNNNESLKNPERVMLWTIPRNLGTIFCKCLSFVPGTRIFHEPFNAAMQLGPERLIDSQNKYYKETIQTYSDIRKSMHAKVSLLPSADDTNWFDSEICSYDWVKKQLEAPMDKDVQMVLCKDIASTLTDNLDKIPEGFRHAILIRNPWKVMPSWKKMMQTMLRYTDEDMQNVDFKDLPRHHVPPKYGYGEMVDLFHYLEKEHQETPIVVDADDLQNNTSSILRQFLGNFGIPYQESFLEWDESDEFSKRWVFCKEYAFGNLMDEYEGWYRKAFTSTSFKPATAAPSQESLTQDLVDIIGRVMPMYEELYQFRIKP